MPQQGFGGGFGMPQQGFGGGFGMPQQGFGGGFGGFGMPQQRQQDMFTPQVMVQPPPPQQPNADASRPFEQFLAAQRMSQGQPGPGGSQSASQSAAPQQGGSSEGPSQIAGAPSNQMQQMMQQVGQQAAMQPRNAVSGNPYSQQMSQEDPRMQAMRYMQRMRFGGGF
jgi:hypothetical protein